MDILALILPVFAVVVVGYATVRIGILPASIAAPLTQFVYRVSLPALMFHIIAGDNIASLLNWSFWLAFGGASLLVMVLVFVVGGRRLGDGLGERSILAAAAAQTNTGFVALPILHSMFGAKGVPPAAIANIIVAALLFPILAAALAKAQGDASGERKPAWRLARDVFLSPMVWPTVLGFVFAAFAIPVPKMANDFLVILGSALTPCALFAIGVSLDLGHILSDRSRILILSTIKMIGLPALVLGIGVALGMAPFYIVTATICASVPSAKNIYFLASEHGIAERSASAMISTTTVAAIVTVSGWLLLLAHLYPEVFHGKV